MLGTTVLGLIAAVLIFLCLSLSSKLKALRRRFRPVIDAEEEAEQLRREVEVEVNSTRAKIRKELETAREEIERDERAHRSESERLKASMDLLREQYESGR